MSQTVWGRSPGDQQASPGDSVTTTRFALRSKPKGKTLYQHRQGAGGLFDEIGAMRSQVAKDKLREQRAGAEAGLSAAAGRSRRSARGGGNRAHLAGVGGDLRRQAATAMSEAKMGELETKLEKEQFMAESLVTPDEADAAAKAHMESNMKRFEGLTGDDEEGLAREMEQWAEGRSPNEQAAAKKYADGLRDGSIKMGWW